MTPLPVDWPALCAIAGLLGLQHGIDADHLVAIDGMTRLNTRHGRRFARWCGVLFATGHGLVVVAVAVAAHVASRRWSLPQGLEAGGGLVSIGMLTLIGVINLASAWREPRAEPTLPRRFAAAQQPATVALVGAVFAISFDTLSQATVFALAATHFGGVAHAAALALVFTTGMLLADGISGLWVSRLIARSDQAAPVSSRVMSLSLAVLSLGVAAAGATRMALPTAGGSGSGLSFGGVVIVLTGAAYLVARALARRDRASSIGPQFPARDVPDRRYGVAPRLAPSRSRNTHGRCRRPRSRSGSRRVRRTACFENLATVKSGDDAMLI